MEIIASAAIPGFFTALTLIAAIGAQNAFIIRQGVARRYVTVVAAFCIISDIILITAGVAGAGALINRHPRVLVALTLFGIAFMSWYAYRSIRAAIDHWKVARRLDRAGGDGSADLMASSAPVEKTLGAVIGGIAAVTWLNPHAYLDTVVLIGSIAASYGDLKWWFTLGAIAASIVWFVTLAAGARGMSKWLDRPKSWVVIELLTAAIMIVIAIELAFGLISG